MRFGCSVPWASVCFGFEYLALATVSFGTAPYVVRIYTNSGVGNTAFVQAGPTLTNAPYSKVLGQLPFGAYSIYAEMTDQGGAGVTVVSPTNTFTVAAPLSVNLITPSNGSSFDWQANMDATGVVFGGTAPYTVRFCTNNVLAGVADGTNGNIYFKGLGNLFTGPHTVQARLTDANGWLSSSALGGSRISFPRTDAIVSNTYGSTGRSFFRLAPRRPGISAAIIAAQKSATANADPLYTLVSMFNAAGSARRFTSVHTAATLSQALIGHASPILRAAVPGRCVWSARGCRGW